MASIMQTISNVAHAVAPSMFVEQKMEEASSPSMRGKMIPSAPPVPTEEDLNKHYLSRDKTYENVTHALASSLNYYKEIVTDLKDSYLPSTDDLKNKIPAAIGLGPQLDERGIPVPPPVPTDEDLHKHYLVPLAPALPTQEMMNKHYLIPMAPPLPTEEDLHRHYLSRDRTLENAGLTIRSAINTASEYAQDLKDAVVQSAPTLSVSRSIPAPPPLPTKEAMHKHYLTRPAFRSNKAYAVDMTQNEREIVDNMYNDRAVVEETASPMFSFSKVRRLANSAQSAASSFVSGWTGSYSEPLSSQGHIPVPPPLPTQEMLHKHYLIPMAPPMPVSEDFNKHYLSRDKTMENAGSALSHAIGFIAEVATEAKDYVLETPFDQMKVDAREVINPTVLDANGIPVPPALPSKQMLHKHFLVPLAPPLPRKGDLHRHYLSRDRTLENAGQTIREAVNLAGELALEAKDAIVDGTIAAKDVVVEGSENAGNFASEKVANASEGISNAVDAIVDGAVQLKEKILPAQNKPVGLKYARSEVISESPIIKKKSAGARRIVPRQDYTGFKPLINAQRI